MIGVYDVNGYSRGRILYKGLLKNKVQVDLFLPRHKLKYISIIKKILSSNCDIILVTGKVCFYLVKSLRLLYRKQVVLDVFISDYDNLINDRKLIRRNSMDVQIHHVI